MIVIAWPILSNLGVLSTLTPGVTNSLPNVPTALDRPHCNSCEEGYSQNSHRHRWDHCSTLPSEYIEDTRCYQLQQERNRTHILRKWDSTIHPWLIFRQRSSAKKFDWQNIKILPWLADSTISFNKSFSFHRERSFNSYLFLLLFGLLKGFRVILSDEKSR